ncbi:VWA domain-containing protein [soil metagenome]
MSITFANPALLLLLLAVPLLAWAAFVRERRRPTGFRFSSVTPARSAPVSWAVRFAWLPTGLRLLALTLGILALARPQMHDTVREEFTEGIDIALVLDLSSSMLATDFYPNRFEAARNIADEFIRGRPSDRIGLIVFAGQAYTQAPLTLDHAFLRTMLAQLRMGLIEDGTAIGTGIATATARLRDSEATSRVMVLLTDGENNRGEIDPSTAAEIAAALGVRIYAVGIGSDQGDGRGVLGGGEMAGVDEALLQHVATTTGGRHFMASDTETLRAVYTEIGDLERSPIQQRVYVDVAERFGLFLWPAFGLILLELLLASTRLRRAP